MGNALQNAIEPTEVVDEKVTIHLFVTAYNKVMCMLLSKAAEPGTSTEVNGATQVDLPHQQVQRSVNKQDKQYVQEARYKATT